MFYGIFIKSLVFCFISVFGNQRENTVSAPVQDLARLNKSFHASMVSGDTSMSRALHNSVLKVLKENRSDSITVSESYYNMGVYHLLQGSIRDAVNWLGSSAAIREQMKTPDTIYAKCLFNLGHAHYRCGDYQRMKESFLQSIEVEKTLYGEDSPELLDGYSALISACIYLKDYNRAIEIGKKALDISGVNRKGHIHALAILYMNMGISHTFLSDYAKALLYLERSESLYKDKSLPRDDNYMNLLNSLASNYLFLGEHEKSERYFNKGISMMSTLNSNLSFNFLNSFALTMGKAGDTGKGESLLFGALDKAEKFYGSVSREYCEVLHNYAEYLRTFKIDIDRSAALFEKCIEIITGNIEDNALKESVLLGYAQTLSDKGRYEKALGIIQELLWEGNSFSSDRLENPPLFSFEPNQWPLKLLKAKYVILHGIYSERQELRYLLAATGTSELIISLIEKIMISISEEQSRLVLSNRFRDACLYTIRDLDLCYRLTDDKTYLEKAFKYSEKSKVVGLLASTREIRATQFHIPEETAEIERKLKMEIGFYESKIKEEESKKDSDSSLVEEWKRHVMATTQGHDSLITVFERMYPSYYLLKYNTEVVSPERIPSISGRNTNYLNYVVTDSLLYIFIVNRKNLRLVTVQIDSTFFNDIRQFRTLLSEPAADSRKGFDSYISIGYNLYRKVFEPIKEHLISDQILISPDNILSYIPFEVLPVAKQENSSQLIFNELPYLLKDYGVSYTYSATILSETAGRDQSFSNSLVAFAPGYSTRINVDSSMNSRQLELSALSDLKFARTEAEYVASLTRGRLYLDDKATESVFKTVASDYDIIHLAMHTLLNDMDPMHSKMLFCKSNDNSEDGNLNTWEIYGIPLKAKMVTLSSCNTGNGALHTGEGILSLARSFVCSGSGSVVMTMWEIEDRSGSEIVQSYYKKLKYGASKSSALRKAKLNFLNSSDMLRSHPYYWASLVIYGNNTPIYSSIWIKIIAAVLLILIILALLLILYRKSR